MHRDWKDSLKQANQKMYFNNANLLWVAGLWTITCARSHSTVTFNNDNKLENHVGSVPTYCAAVRLTFDLLSWKLANRLLLPWETYFVMVVLSLYVFKLGACTEQTENRRRDGLTDRQDVQYSLVGWPHNWINEQNSTFSQQPGLS